MDKNVRKGNYNDLDSIVINIASPNDIRSWSYGEVKSPKDIDRSKNIPHEGGLFCEKIFGPVNSYECKCGKYKGMKYEGHICEECGVEVANKNVRRERMGHIELVAPVVNYIFYENNYINYLLGIKKEALRKVIYYEAYIVTDPMNTDLNYKDIISYQQYDDYIKEYGYNSFSAEIGASAIKTLLGQIDLEKEINDINDDINFITEPSKKKSLLKRLSVLEKFNKSNNELTSLVLDVVPVIPPDLRPMIRLDGGRYAVSDLNEFYKRIISRNNNIREAINNDTPTIIINDMLISLQKSVDALMDNESLKEDKIAKISSRTSRQAYKSLAESLKGKDGRFRHNMLGKRVDYSGRSVIVIGPDLKIYQCGVPKNIALELFKPFVMHELCIRDLAKSIKEARRMVDEKDNNVWNVLDDVIKGKTVILNRQPTLHRLSMQAFEPVLVDGKAIKLHPLVCTAFNADFDGDQMAIHLSLSKEAQKECREIMLSSKNLLKPADGEVIAVPSQDMILGLYYLSMYKYSEIMDSTAKPVKKYQRKDEKANIDAVLKDLKNGKINKDSIILIKINGKISKEGDVIRYKDILSKAIDIVGRRFKSKDDVFIAFDNKEITLQQPIYLEREVIFNNEMISGYVKTSLGRIILNDVIPQDLGIIDRSDKDEALKFEVDTLIGKKQVKDILNRTMNIHGMDEVARLLDDMKSLGFKYSTLSGITVSVDDMDIPDEKETIITDTQKQVDNINILYKKGHITGQERYMAVISTWEKTDKKLTGLLLDNLDTYNNIYVMADSGARGSEQQIKQLAGMRGLMADTTGKTIEVPIKSNFREGLNVLEYFISAHGARKGMSDTALRTADAGYLTRRVVTATENIVIRYEDCTDGNDVIPGTYISPLKNGEESIEPLMDRIIGRYVAEDILDSNNNIIIEMNQLITKEKAKNIIEYGIDSYGTPFITPEHEENPDAKIKIRSVLTCKAPMGICKKCYGINNATGDIAKIGDAVGVMAAQSIGEPGTQLTMRTFHTGGVAGGGDITQGLPRVEKILDVTKESKTAILSEMDGRVEVIKEGNINKIIVLDDINKVKKEYTAKYGYTPIVKSGDTVSIGDPLTIGSYDLNMYLSLKGVEALQQYIIAEIQKVYRLQGININDKHLEIVVHEMLKKTQIDSVGDSMYKEFDIIDTVMFNELNEMLKEEGKRVMKGHPIIMGIKNIIRNSDSFLTAASFESTLKALTSAAIESKLDPLLGIKENIIIGRKIPAGTGYKK